MNKFVVGITGGIACGKSVLSSMIEERKFCVIDADIVSRKVVEKGSVGEGLLLKSFSEAFSNGVLDRRKLRNIVFGNSYALAKLNSITHPLIAFEVKKQIENSKESLIFFICPLLFEGGFNSLCDYTLSISCCYETQLKRLLGRDGISTELAKQMTEAQMPFKKRNELSDEVIFNDGSIEEFKIKVDEFITKILHKLEIR